MVTTTTATTVGQRLVDLCREGKHTEAINELYADDVVSVEAAPMEGMPQTMKGKEAVMGKNNWWAENNEVHNATTEGPFPHGDDKFAAFFFFDTTFKPTGQRMEMKEVGLYTIENGKIAKEEFFYQSG